MPVGVQANFTVLVFASESPASTDGGEHLWEWQVKKAGFVSVPPDVKEFLQLVHWYRNLSQFFEEDFARKLLGPSSSLILEIQFFFTRIVIQGLDL
ncbi:hypothetical protein AVEN_123625-1 [Araneus ventricosus]|uniref:Uncharacterized protein n=1 Tax=Araneus ventricosus TaxID=182803 RepID=A0A4Y2SKI2_ARAVE|nr:hypothetical protein AVEN_123625-1 [Araneus ventricosus]